LIEAQRIPKDDLLSVDFNMSEQNWGLLAPMIQRLLRMGTGIILF